MNGNGTIQIDDAVAVFRHAFLGIPLPCELAADLDWSRQVDLRDGIALLLFLFRETSPGRYRDTLCRSPRVDEEPGCEQTAESCLDLATIFVIGVDSSARGNPIRLLKREVISRVMDLPEGSELALIFVGSTILRFPQSEGVAVIEGDVREGAIEFVASLSTPRDGDRVACDSDALFLALEFARSARSDRVDIGYFPRGCFSCGVSIPPEDARRLTADAVDAILLENRSVRAFFHVFSLGLPEERCASILTRLQTAR